MQLRISIAEQINIFRGEIIQIINNIDKQTIWGIIILGYILLLGVFLYIHSKLLKKQKKIHENLIETYDSIRYQLAKAQYQNPTIQNSKGIKILWESDHKNYPANEKEIKEELLSLQQQGGQEIISQEQRDTISKQTHKKNSITIVVQTIGRIITTITIGIYKVFW